MATVMGQTFPYHHAPCSNLLQLHMLISSLSPMMDSHWCPESQKIFAPRHSNANSLALTHTLISSPMVCYPCLSLPYTLVCCFSVNSHTLFLPPSLSLFLSHALSGLPALLSFHPFCLSVAVHPGKGLSFVSSVFVSLFGSSFTCYYVWL